MIWYRVVDKAGRSITALECPAKAKAIAKRYGGRAVIQGSAIDAVERTAHTQRVRESLQKGIPWSERKDTAEAMAAEARRLIGAGATAEEVAQALGVTVRTAYRYASS